MENISKYLEDKRFIQWVFRPNNELEKWWKTFETGYPKEKHNIQLARKILLRLKTSDKNLSEEEKILLFSKILKQIEEKQNVGKSTLFIKSFLKYAAVAFLFFSMGALLFYKKDNFNPQFYSQKFLEPATENQARLIRPNGENILLGNKKSVIEYKEDGKITVNDKIVESSTYGKKGVPELNQLIIPYGKTSEILLPDGTKVYLNAGSRLVYPEFFNGKNREILLVGEAFFEVFPDNKHPFVVQTTDIRINVMGTKFNVSAYPTDNSIETVLTEGKVRLEQNNPGLFSESLEMKPNQLAIFDKTSRETKVKMVDTDNYTLWKNGMFQFESTDLNRVIKKLERYYNIRFQFSYPMLGLIRISGKLELDENREEIINRIAVTASVKIIKKGEFLYEINK